MCPLVALSFVRFFIGATTKNARTLAEGRPPDPLPCQNSLSQDKSLLGGWVADVVLGNPVGEVLRGFMDEEVSSTNPSAPTPPLPPCTRAIKRELCGEQVSIPRDPTARHDGRPRASQKHSGVESSLCCGWLAYHGVPLFLLAYVHENVIIP